MNLRFSASKAEGDGRTPLHLDMTELCHDFRQGFLSHECSHELSQLVVFVFCDLCVLITDPCLERHLNPVGRVGFAPTTRWISPYCSTTELPALFPIHALYLIKGRRGLRRLVVMYSVQLLKSIYIAPSLLLPYLAHALFDC